MKNRCINSTAYRSFRRLYRINAQNLLANVNGIQNCVELVSMLRNALDSWDTGLGEKPNSRFGYLFAGGVTVRYRNGARCYHLHVSNSLSRWLKSNA